MQPWPKLEQHVDAIMEGDLDDEIWGVPNSAHFSVQKPLYGYQMDALRKAKLALYRYYGLRQWRKNETLADDDARKRDFAGIYRHGGKSLLAPLNIKETGSASHVFRILSEFVDPVAGAVPYWHFINRMCFWMATGSGKTLVMVKLVEFLHALKRRGAIPQRDILILAPGEVLLAQIKKAVYEFNLDPGNRLKIDLVHLREAKRPRQTTIDDSAVVYYHDSNNVSDEQTQQRIDFARYERGGEWYVVLDEAHKGGKENSKRQAYYALMARRGFLFNFSATFTDDEDIFTTVKKYNLHDFVYNGYGKKIYLNKAEYAEFKDRGCDIDHAERKQIVLKSLVTLAYVSKRVRELRRDKHVRELRPDSDRDIYHLPLMLTLANSVSTRDKDRQNDLWAFFSVLREIAAGEIDADVFAGAKKSLSDEWRTTEFLFDSGEARELIGNARDFDDMRMEDVRAEIFHSRQKGAIEYIRSSKSTELAFQLKSADTPFALVSIGEISQWRNTLLRGYEESAALQEKGFFESLDENRIMILMGSRKFIESWDTNRPNVINFINIGSRDAKKYVLQSIGRGVRIEPIRGKRGIFSRLREGNDAEAEALRHIESRVAPVETLFLFATNQGDIKSVLSGIKETEDSAFEPLTNFALAKREQRDGQQMLLLAPVYETVSDDSRRPPFAMHESEYARLKAWVKATPESVFIVRDSLDECKFRALKEVTADSGKVCMAAKKKYFDLAELQERVVDHSASEMEVPDGVAELQEDYHIVHFRRIRVRTEYAALVREKLDEVRENIEKKDAVLARVQGISAQDKAALARESGEKSFQVASGFPLVKFKRIAGHYYFPLILWETEKPGYLQHIISAESEVHFVNALDRWVSNNPDKAGEWTWMFSKIDEACDHIYIPYYENAPRKFYPDFIFWLWRDGEYRIVFVDPKGGAHTSAYTKIDGYKNLFVDGKNSPRVFPFKPGNVRVQVELFMFNATPHAPPLREYEDYWTNTPAAIFRAA